MRPGATIHLKEERFMERKAELDTRVRLVTAGLEGVGLTVAPLDTQALIELFYATYNPDVAMHEALAKVGELQVEDT